VDTARSRQEETVEDAPRRLVAEAIGAFTLTFIGAGAIIATKGGDLLAVAIAHGLAIGVMVCALGHVSGGHFNPAISFGMFLTRRLTPNEFAAYVVAQCLGAIVAALILAAIYSRDLVKSASPALGSGVGAGSGLVVEIVLTFFLVLVVFGVAVDPRSSFAAVGGLAIGLTISIDILMGGPLTGAAMNPSRWIGTAIVGGQWSDFWIWIVAPAIGGAIAALLYEHLIRPPRAA
jgi:aquaporin Z